MRLTGIVMEQEGAHIRVCLIFPECREPKSWRPAGAMECAGCRACDRSPRGDKESAVVEGDAGGHRFENGDRVAVEMEEAGAWWPQLLTFGLPLAGLLGGMAAGAGHGWKAALFSLAGLTAGFAVLKLLDRYAAEPLLRRKYAFAPEHDALSEDLRSVEAPAARTESER